MSENGGALREASSPPNRMLGSLSEADDAVQQAWLRLEPGPRGLREGALPLPSERGLPGIRARNPRSAVLRMRLPVACTLRRLLSLELHHLRGDDPLTDAVPPCSIHDASSFAPSKFQVTADSTPTR
jgi:hypothetical protein